MNEDGTPLRSVFESSFVTIKVAKIPVRIIRVSKIAEKREEYVLSKMKNIVNTDINIGNLPLQGTKLFVSMAKSRSLGESMILQPTTPAALQPKPIHMVNDCFPQAQHFLKGLSRL